MSALGFESLTAGLEEALFLPTILSENGTPVKVWYGDTTPGELMLCEHSFCLPYKGADFPLWLRKSGALFGKSHVFWLLPLHHLPV